MRYIEMSVEEAKKRCKKNTKVLVAVQDLEEYNDIDILFTTVRQNEYDRLFEDVQTVASICDDFVKQLKLFTEKQDIRHIRPYGMQKIVLLKE